MDDFILYRYWFEQPFLRYVICYGKQALLTLALAFVGKMTSDYLFHNLGINLFTWILCGIVVSVITVGILALLYWKKEDFQYYKNLFLKIVRNRKV